MAARIPPGLEEVAAMARAAVAPRQPRDVWVSLVRAAKKGKSITLRPAEVERLVASDDAIRSAAESYERACVCDIMRRGATCRWCEAQGEKR